MRYFECVADKKVFKTAHGYDKSFEDWVNEELRKGYLRMLSQCY